MAILQQAIEGKYEVLEKIKEGGMGAVYKALHRELDEIRVIKVIRPNLEPTPDLRERFRREAQVANRLRHPNIAMLHDFAVGDDGNAFIVMEFIDGLTLEDLLRLSGPPSVGLALEIGRQALRAIGYLHRRGYVHRDVAPDNLMLTRGVDGEPLVKLIDLGIAKVLEGEGGHTSTGMFLGKPRYASPEHFGAEARVSEKSDLYSFGVVLYELLTGRCPIQGRDPASYMAGHLLRPVLDFADTDPHGRIPSDLRWVLLRTLAKKADERIESAEELARHLTASQAQLPWHPADLEHALATARSAAAAEYRTGSGVSSSIQSFLDRQFAAGATPTPTARLGLAGTPVPATELLPPLPPATETLSAPGFGRQRPGETAAIDLRTGRPIELDDTVSLPGRGGPRPGWDTVRWDTAALPVEGSALPRPAPRPAALTPPERNQRRAWIGPTLILLFVAIALCGGLWLYLHPVEPGPDAGPSPAVAPSAPAPAAIVPEAPAAAPPAAAASTAGTDLATTLPTSPKPGDSAKPSAAPPATRVGDALPVPGADGTIRPGPGVEYPEPDSIPGAVYPEAAKGSGKNPTVMLQVLVDETGKVIEARVKEGDRSNLGFNEAAREAALKARFLPAKKDGVPGRMWADLGIEFTPPP